MDICTYNSTTQSLDEHIDENVPWYIFDQHIIFAVKAIMGSTSFSVNRLLYTLHGLLATIRIRENKRDRRILYL
jgi:hypothetical protein